MEFNELANLIKSRRSIRVWQDKEVTEELLTRAIELATWAPNAANQQNWRFYLIMNRAIIKEIADAVQASADRMAAWSESAKFGNATVRWQQRASFFRTAPAAIAIAAAQYQSIADQILAAREEGDSQARQMRQWRQVADSRIQSVSSAVAYLLLILHQMGLGAIWMTGPIQAKGEIEKILKVPSEMDVVTFIPVGYPVGVPAPMTRKPVGEVLEVVRG